MHRAAPHFSGFAAPNYTMVPDQVFDELLVELSGAELKVLLYIIRRTFGFKKERDAISLNQMLHGIATREGQTLDRGCGLSKPTLLGALRSLTVRGIVVSQRRRSVANGDEPTEYRLRLKGEAMSNDEPSGNDAPLSDSASSETSRSAEQASSEEGGGKEILPGGWSKNLTTQDTVIQDTDISNIRTENIQQQEMEAVYAQTTLVVHEDEDDREVLPAVEQGYVDNLTPSLTVSGGFSTVADTMKQRQEALQARGSASRDTLSSRIQQLAQEFGDRASLKSSTSRAEALLTKSGLPLKSFLNCLWEARAITRERISHPPQGKPIKKQMAYFFSVLSERLGLQGGVGEAA